MKILLLAPHPFYQDRGTPIAVRLILQVLSERGDSVDVLTYHEGEEIRLPNVNIRRICRPPLVRNVPPGPSWKKLVCDAFMLAALIPMVIRTRYDLIHAVEESVFMARAARLLRRTPYVYDMDSSMAQQVVEKFRALRPLSALLGWFEARAIRGAVAVVPVCDALAELAGKRGARKIVILRDISLLSPPWAPAPAGLTPAARDGGITFMYVGNLETYQGMDLLIESFAAVVARRPDARLVVAGGAAGDIRKYRRKADDLGVASLVEFLGPKPLSMMGTLFETADVLVSPRIKGNNTPMKIYSYLDSGKPIVATDLPTHTQVLTPEVAALARPDREDFARAMLSLAESPELRARIAAAAKALAQSHYSFPVYRRTLCGLYDELGAALAAAG